MPTDSRIRLSGTSSGEPAAEAWVIWPGCSMRLSTAPSDSASVNSCGRRDDLERRLARRRAREADHAAEVAHLLGRRGVAGMVGQLRVQHALDGRMADAAGRRSARAFAQWRSMRTPSVFTPRSTR